VFLKVLGDSEMKGYKDKLCTLKNICANYGNCPKGTEEILKHAPCFRKKEK